MRIRKVFAHIVPLCAALSLGGCTEDSASDYQPARDGLVVTFNTYIGTRAGTAGAINDAAALRQAGFGVFAYYNDNTAWADDQTTLAPNFMYNQQVDWTDTDDDGIADSWTYSPVKYWPNNNNPADDGTATGTQTYSYLSFFAYAPYAGATPSTGATSDNTYGITSLTTNTTQGAPKLTYKWSAATDNQVDLLYATPQTDLYKTKLTGEGFTDGEVMFTFRHALACIDFHVQRVIDDGTEDSFGSAEGDTRIFISSLTLTPTAAMPTTGTFNLATTSWESTVTDGGDAPISITAASINDDISGTSSTDADDIKEAELDKYATGLPGVNATAQPLLSTGRAVIVMPEDDASFDIDMTYSFITQDNELALSQLTDYLGNRYGRIVNSVSKSGVTIGDIEQGKKYTVLIKIGVEEVTFEVTGVEDWYFPMRLTPSTTDYNDGGTTDLVGNEE